MRLGVGVAHSTLPLLVCGAAHRNRPACQIRSMKQDRQCMTACELQHGCTAWVRDDDRHICYVLRTPAASLAWQPALPMRGALRCGASVAQAPASLAVPAVVYAGCLSLPSARVGNVDICHTIVAVDAGYFGGIASAHDTVVSVNGQSFAFQPGISTGLAAMSGLLSKENMGWTPAANKSHHMEITLRDSGTHTFSIIDADDATKIWSKDAVLRGLWRCGDSILVTVNGGATRLAAGASAATEWTGSSAIHKQKAKLLNVFPSVESVDVGPAAPLEGCAWEAASRGAAHFGLSYEMQWVGASTCATVANSAAPTPAPGIPCTDIIATTGSSATARAACEADAACFGYMTNSATNKYYKVTGSLEATYRAYTNPSTGVGTANFNCYSKRAVRCHVLRPVGDNVRDLAAGSPLVVSSACYVHKDTAAPKIGGGGRGSVAAYSIKDTWWKDGQGTRDGTSCPRVAGRWTVNLATAYSGLMVRLVVQSGCRLRVSRHTTSATKWRRAYGQVLG